MLIGLTRKGLRWKSAGGLLLKTAARTSNLSAESGRSQLFNGPNVVTVKERSFFKNSNSEELPENKSNVLFTLGLRPSLRRLSCQSILNRNSFDLISFPRDLRRFFSNSSFEFHVKERPPPKKSHLVLRILRNLFLITGAGVWFALIVVLLMVDDIKVQKTETMDLSSERETAQRTLKFYGIIRDSDLTDEEKALTFEPEEVKREMDDKQSALALLWDKLRNEEGVKLPFGSPVEFCGYKCSDVNKDFKSDLFGEDDDRNFWQANCLIEGKHGMGILKVVFERHDSEAEWTATRVHLEKVQESGEVVCNVSSPLPNGLKNFTRLSDI
eukprot:Seg23678.1 transcript_id=Seg23678.1/GoldUCD/mRNA.D3Y31 product="hypothetical protein" protein_id=Seg23678.1/GoldUCD/D3Y31